MVLTTSRPDTKPGGSDLSLFRDVFTGEVMRFWSQAYIMDGKYLDKKLDAGGKGSFDRWSGTATANVYSRGINILDYSGPASQGVKFTEYITRVDMPLYKHDIQTAIDYLLSPSGAQDRMGITKALAESIALVADLRGLLAVISSASHQHPDVNPTTHPYITKTSAGTAAGFSSTSGTNDGKYGLDINSALTSTATGATIEDELFKLGQYFDYLGVPTEDRYAAMTPTYKQALWRAQGQRVTVDHSGSNTITHPASESMPNPPMGMAEMKHEGSGFIIVPMRHLNALGTNYDAALALTGAGDKYAPGTGFSGVTIASINGENPASSKVFQANQGSSNPDAWTGGTKNTLTLFDKVRIVAWHKRAIRRVVAEGFQSFVGPRPDILNDFLLWTKLTIGYGAADPTSACYAVEAVP